MSIHRHALVALVALGSFVSSASAQGDAPRGEVDVVVVPFSTDGVADDEGVALASETVASFKRQGRDAELAGVSLEQILMLSGCDASDDVCLATIPETLGAKTVVFGSARNADGQAVVVLVVVDADAQKRKRSFTLVGATRDERVARFGAEVDGGREAASSTPADVATEPIAEPVLGASLAEPTRSRVPWERSRVRRSAWIVGGAGAGAVVTGGLLLLIGNATESSIKDAPTDTVGDLEHLETLESRAGTLYTLGNILLVGGLVTTLVGGGLIYHQGTQAPNEQPDLVVGPTAFRGGVGISIEGAWR